MIVVERAVGPNTVEFSEPRQCRLIVRGCQTLGITYTRSRAGWRVVDRDAEAVREWLRAHGARLVFEL